MTFSGFFAIVVIAFDDSLIELLAIDAIAMDIITLQVFVLDVAIARLIIGKIVLDIHDNDLVILPH
jgi:hypothetical protein